MYLFNIFKESKVNDHIITLLKCSDTNLRFLLKVIFKNSKSLLNTIKLSFLSLRTFYKSK